MRKAQNQKKTTAARATAIRKIIAESPSMSNFAALALQHQLVDEMEEAVGRQTEGESGRPGEGEKNARNAAKQAPAKALTPNAADSAQIPGAALTPIPPHPASPALFPLHPRYPLGAAESTGRGTNARTQSLPHRSRFR